jgi:hypothetical protein
VIQLPEQLAFQVFDSTGIGDAPAQTFALLAPVINAILFSNRFIRLLLQ